MIEFLTTKGAIYYVEQILKARERIVLVSPFIKISKVFYERLQDAGRRGVPIQIVAREIENGREKDLLNVPGLELFKMPNLHAKCYMSERLLVITSLNLYESSEQNREMGVLFTPEEPVYESTKEEIDSILSAASRVARPTRAPMAANSAKSAPR